MGGSVTNIHNYSDLTCFCFSIMMTSNLYSYCDICRLNHTKKRRHIYSKKHKDKVNAILKKFAKRIKEIQLFLQNPVVEEGVSQEGATFWCHFCKDNISKHVTDNLKTILYGGVLEHLSCDAHSDAMNTFWYEHGVEEKNKEQFRIPQVNVELYKKKLMKVVDEHDKSVQERLSAIKRGIEHQEHARLVLIHGEQDHNSDNHNFSNNHHGGSKSYQLANSKCTSHHSGTNSNIVFTTDAQGEGLTSIKVKSTGRGNIHTGAIPPWMCSETGDAEQVIGPTQADYEHHIEHKKKSKLNPDRVGANFDHNGESSSGWLPSFGRVWNDGARWKSRMQYYNESGAGPSKS